MMNSSASENVLPTLRPANEVMDLARLGRQFPTRLSFMRVLIRNMCQQQWHIEREFFELDARGAGCSVYRIDAPARSYRMVLFAEDLDPARRSDRVIADAWDVTGALCFGPVDAKRRKFLSENVPRQEAGRLDSDCIVLTRANRSSRQFARVVDALAAGRQPSLAEILEVGYLLRTTAVYGSGKFGMSDWASVRENHPDLSRPFAAEMLACFMLRKFSFDQVEWLAQIARPESACNLDPGIKRGLGIGNATGLGMAPFLVRHPLLIGRWILQRERALAIVLADTAPGADRVRTVLAVLKRAAIHLDQVRIGDPEQTQVNRETRSALIELRDWLAVQGDLPDWHGVTRHAQRTGNLESRQVLESALIEAYGDRVDHLADDMVVDETYPLLSTMRGEDLFKLIEDHYGWALRLDFEQPDSQAFFWYRSEEKMEPRLGRRGVDPGEDREMQIGIALEIVKCHRALRRMLDSSPEISTAEFVLRHPECRYIVRRMQTLAEVPFGEIQANLLDATMRPIDLLRCKLAFMGVTKFDPRSSLWVRNTMFQGAPLIEDLHPDTSDDWSFPILHEGETPSEPCFAVCA